MESLLVEGPLSVPKLVRCTVLAFLATSVPFAFGSGRPAQSPKLPLVDRHDIRFIPVTEGGAPFRSQVFSVIQDNQGFIWIGTGDGLYRYDGYSLKPYRHQPGDHSTLSDDTVRVLYKDRSGTIWIGTFFGGLNRLDPVSGTLTHYRHSPADAKSLSSNNVSSISEDRSGALWVGTTNGLDRFDPSTRAFVHFKHDPADSNSLSDNCITALLGDRAGNLWIGTASGGLNKLVGGSGPILRFQHDPVDAGTISHNYVNDIKEDRSGMLWVSSPFGAGLSTLDPKTGRSTRYRLQRRDPGNREIAGLNRIYEDRNGVLWLATIDHGLVKLDEARTEFSRYAKNENSPHSLHHNTVQTVFEDAEHVMWVGTDSGLYRFAETSRLIQSYQHDPGNPNSLRDNLIWSVRTGSRGDLWVGTENGLNKVDRATGRFTLFRHDPSNPHALPSNKVSAIREDRSGTVWCATYGGGLSRYDRKTGRFFTYRHSASNPRSLASDLILALLIDRSGTLWVATQGGGLNRFDARTGTFRRYRNDPRNPRSLSNDSAIAVSQDRSGTIWVGTLGGLNRFDSGTDQFTVYRNDPEDVNSLSHDKVLAIYQDKRERLWVGTENGLNRFDPKSGAFVRFTRKDGLPDGSIAAILEDGRGRLWLATRNGLSRFDPESGVFRSYSEADGLPPNFPNKSSQENACKSPDGELIFGSNSGVTAFNPDRLQADPFLPRVVLTGFQLFNQQVSPGSGSPLSSPIWATNSLTLSHRQTIFTLEFAGLSYRAPERTRYRYRLDGLETAWNAVDSGRRFATYTNLSPGRYTFLVQASTTGEVWNTQGVNLHLRIQPPWWSTWWVRTLLAAIVAVLMVAVYRYRVTRIYEVFEERLAERTRIAQDLHDTLLQDVVAVGLQLDIVDDQLKNDPEAAKPTLEVIRRRVRQVSDLGRRTLWGLRSVTSSASDLVESLSRLGEELRTGDSPGFQVLVQGRQHALHALIHDEVERVGREAITNAFRHARAQWIEVVLMYSDHSLQLTVRDDGAGIPTEILLKGRTGHFGLVGMRERAIRIGARLTVQSRLGHGTEVIMMVPLRTSARNSHPMPMTAAIRRFVLGIARRETFPEVDGPTLTKFEHEHSRQNSNP